MVKEERTMSTTLMMAVMAVSTAAAMYMPWLFPGSEGPQQRTSDDATMAMAPPAPADQACTAKPTQPNTPNTSIGTDQHCAAFCSRVSDGLEQYIVSDGG